MTTPASNIEAAVGAAEWPVGAQVWNGHMPASTAKPMNTSGKQKNWKSGAKPMSLRASRSKVVPPALAHNARMPTKTNALPVKL